VKYAQCVKIWQFDVLVLFRKCVKFLKYCVQFDGHYTESSNSLVSDEEKGRRAHVTRVSYLRRRETRPRNARLLSQEHASLFYLTCTKKNIY
jgi:hypothetical protein